MRPMAPRAENRGLREASLTLGSCLRTKTFKVNSTAEWPKHWIRQKAKVMRFQPFAAPSIEAREDKPKDKPSNKPARKGKPGPKPKPVQMRSILTPHYFRHNFATLMYDADIDILTAVKIFGHKDKSILLDVYTELSKAKERASVERIDCMFK
jgi:integrase